MEYIQIFFGTILDLFYSLTSSYGVSIILFTLLVKLLLFPLDLKQRKSTARMQKIQPVLNEIQRKYGNDREKLNMETMKVYRQYKISPTSGCLPMLIQLPIIFALYWVIRQPITYMMGIRDLSDQALIIVNFNDWAPNNLGELSEGLRKLFEGGQKITGNNYSMYEIQIAQLMNNGGLQNFVGPTALANNLGSIGSVMSSAGANAVDFTFLGLNLAETPALGAIGPVLSGNFGAIWSQKMALWLIPIFSGLSSWFSSRLSQAGNQPKQDKNRVIPENEKVQENKQAGTMKTMTVIMPIISAWFCFQFPAALGLYWIIGNVIQIVQLVVINKIILPKIDDDIIKGDVIDVKENRKKRKKR